MPISEERWVRRHSNGVVMTLYQAENDGPFLLDLSPLMQSDWFPALPTLTEAQIAADEYLRHIGHLCDVLCTPWRSIARVIPFERPR